MKKIISYSLWGNNLKYLVGAVKNSILAKEFYPGWCSRFFVHNEVDKDVVKELNKNGAEIFFFDSFPKWGASLYRLIPINDEKAERVIFRDCDGRLSKRESEAVKEWESSDFDFHIMKDHPYHGSFPILAGMFGCKTFCISNIENRIAKYINGEEYHTDQQFIQNNIWPLTIGNSLTHDEFFSQKDFPTKRNGEEYVGEPFDENDNPCDVTHREALKKFIS